jgi:hypothetical protein
MGQSVTGWRNLGSRLQRNQKNGFKNLKSTKRQRIMELRKPIDSPRIQMDFKNTVPGIYQVKLFAYNSYLFR